MAVTLQPLYPRLKVYVRVQTLKDQDELVAKGIKRGPAYYLIHTMNFGTFSTK